MQVETILQNFKTMKNLKSKRNEMLTKRKHAARNIFQELLHGTDSKDEPNLGI